VARPEGLALVRGAASALLKKLFEKSFLRIFKNFLDAVVVSLQFNRIRAGLMSQPLIF
jgi:hypothetical protein